MPQLLLNVKILPYFFIQILYIPPSRHSERPISIKYNLYLQWIYLHILKFILYLPLYNVILYLLSSQKIKRAQRPLFIMNYTHKAQIIAGHWADALMCVALQLEVTYMN